MLLSELKEGQTATIERIGGNGALRRRILEMGIVKGTDAVVEKLHEWIGTGEKLEEANRKALAETQAEVDRIWDTMWSGGISNPLSVIEQLTYLLFIKRLHLEDGQS